MSVVHYEKLKDYITIYNPDDPNLPEGAKALVDAQKGALKGVDVSEGMRLNNAHDKELWKEKTAVFKLDADNFFAGRVYVTDDPNQPYMVVTCPPGRIKNEGDKQFVDKVVEELKDLIDMLSGKQTKPVLKKDSSQ